VKSVSKTLIFAGVAGALAAAGYFGWRAMHAPAKSPTYLPLHVTRGDLRVTVQATGSVQPENRLVIKPPINGRIEQIKVDEGVSVRKGQVLALMSSTDRAALLDVARSKGPAEVAHWEDVYRPTPIIAPLGGLIIAKSVEPGQTISTTDQVFAMSDHLIVVAQVDETDMAKVHLGQTAEIVLDAYNSEKIAGKVHQIAFDARTVNNVTVYDVQIMPASVPEFMRSGMTTSVNFMVAEKAGVLTVPMAAIRQEGGKATVLIGARDQPEGGRRSDEHPEERQVELGLSDGKTVEVKSGLAEGDTVLQEVLHLPDAKTGTNPFGPQPKGGTSRPPR